MLEGIRALLKAMGDDEEEEDTEQHNLFQALQHLVEQAAKRGVKDLKASLCMLVGRWCTEEEDPTEDEGDRRGRPDKRDQGRGRSRSKSGGRSRKTSR